MYTDKKYTAWNCVLSKASNAENGVIWGVIVSPMLFCFNIDELLNRMSSSGLGCQVGHLSYSDLGMLTI